MNARLFKLSSSSGVPLYLQLMEQIKHAIETCALMPGDQLPGIRTLAQDLVISPNTVVRAYTELDREGVIELRHGAGAFVTDQERSPRQADRVRAAKALVSDIVEKLRGRGFSDAEIRRLVEAELVLAEEEARR